MNDMRTNAAMAVLEEVMERVIDEPNAARQAGQRERLMAFVDVLDWVKTQSDVMDLEPFANHSLNDLEPLTLLAEDRLAA